MKLSAEVLNLHEFDPNIFKVQIKEIRVPEFFKVIFVFVDGRMVEKVWENKSRKDSWGEKEKQKAREQQLDYLERNKTKWIDLEMLEQL